MLLKIFLIDFMLIEYDEFSLVIFFWL